MIAPLFVLMAVWRFIRCFAGKYNIRWTNISLQRYTELYRLYLLLNYLKKLMIIISNEVLEGLSQEAFNGI
jgi:hypothetical protein